MFKQQEILIESSPALREILARYQWKSSPESWLEQVESDAKNFVVTLPLIGAFSAGKSSLLNTVLGDKLLSTNIDPETTFPAELSYGSAEKLVGILPNGHAIPLTRDDLRNNLAEKLTKGSYVSATLNNPLLAKLPHLRLVDMPGWESGIDAHNAAIDGYAARSLAYCVVVSAEEGNLRESLRRALRELAVRQMPILAVISKADKKLPEDIEAVERQVAQEVESVTGHPPFAVVSFSNRDKTPTELIAALEKLEKNAEAQFQQNVTKKALNHISGFWAYLDTLINSDDLDSEKIKSQCDQLNAEMATFQSRLNDETTQLEARVQPVLGRIVEHIENSLHDELDSLVDSAMHGGEIGDIINYTIRLAVEEGIAREFTPEISRYLTIVDAALPEHFAPQIPEISGFAMAEDKESGSPQLVVTPLLTMALPLLKFVPIPHLKVASLIASAILPIIGFLENMFSSKKRREVEEAEQREEIKDQILRKVVPDTLKQARRTLQSVLDDHIGQAKQAIVNSTQAQLDSHLAALNELTCKLAEGQAAFAKAKTQFENDRDALRDIVTRLEKA